MPHVFSHRSLQGLYEAARLVLDKGESPERLRESLEQLETMVAFRESPHGQEILGEARELYSHPFGDVEDVEIDDGTCVYYNGSQGYWVMAWCFVQTDEEEFDSDVDEPAESYAEPDIVSEQPPKTTCG